MLDIDEIERKFFQPQPLSNIDMHDLILEVRRLRDREKDWKALANLVIMYRNELDDTWFRQFYSHLPNFNWIGDNIIHLMSKLELTI